MSVKAGATAPTKGRSKWKESNVSMMRVPGGGVVRSPKIGQSAKNRIIKSSEKPSKKCPKPERSIYSAVT